MRTCFSIASLALIWTLVAAASCGGPDTRATRDSDPDQSKQVKTARPEPSDRPAEPALDSRVKAFLNEKGNDWRDMNVSVDDGQFMYDIIVERGYKRALEIGTSTGHSAIWIAWALSKTGGKLITVEIDETRHNQALENFEKAGLAPYIDARLADAHQLVKELEGPFDFVFSDADKDWYKQYFIDVAPKMTAGGCYITHNIWMHGHHREGEHLEGHQHEGEHDESHHEKDAQAMNAYVEYLKSRADFDTTIERDKTSGVGVSCRKENPN